MSKLSWRVIRQMVYDRADGCCEYCQTCEANTWQAMHTEHIDPNGGDILDNLCLSCSSCNLSKSAVISAQDVQTHQIVSLFNPRTQVWHEHFEWIDAGLRVSGITPTGRATVNRLKMNIDRVVRARRRWIEGGNHPP